MKLLFATICISALLAGCTNAGTGTGDMKSYDLDSFEVIDLSGVEPEAVSPNEMVMGMPLDMCMVSDSIMAFKDARADKLLWLLNVNNGNFAQCLSRGKGPDECLRVANIWSDGGSLFASGSQDRKVMKITVNPVSLACDIECVAVLPANFLQAVTLSEGDILYAPTAANGARYLINHLDGTVADTVGVFHPDKIEGDVRPNNAMFQMQLALSPDKSHLVASNLSWNRIEIYSVPFGETVVLNGPIETDSKAKVYDIGIGTSFGQKPAWHMFAGVAACDDGFALGFIGRELKTEADYGKGIESVLFFDWEGNPIKMVKLDRQVEDFTVDFGSATIYAVIKEPEPTIVRYRLPVSYDELMKR